MSFLTTLMGTPLSLLLLWPIACLVMWKPYLPKHVSAGLDGVYRLYYVNRICSGPFLFQLSYRRRVTCAKDERRYSRPHPPSVPCPWSSVWHNR